MTTIGIDLGTTNSLVAVYETDGPRLIENALGDVLTPSVVGIADDGQTVLTGMAAKKRLVRHPEQTRALFKRLMGSDTVVTLKDKRFSAIELSALILGSLRQDAERDLGHKVTDAIISVPAYFNAVQRQATKDAAEIAGLKVRRLINEPTAAALANGVLDREEESTFVVLDLGGGTFDVSILEMFDGVMEVRSSAGDSFLGGEDFTEAVAKHLAEQISLVWETATAAQKEKLITLSESLKRALQDAPSAKGRLEINNTEHEFSLNETQFEQITSGLIARLHRPLEKCLYDAGISPEDVDRVILVGGATRMSAVRSLAARVFRRLPERQINPDHAIALGAAVQAGLVDRHEGLRDVVLTDVAPFSMGIETRDERDGYTIDGAFAPIIERNTVLPASRSQYFYTVIDKQKHITARIYQGEAAIARDNILLGEIDVPIPSAPKGHEGIEVRFTYDVSGLLAVDVRVLSLDKTISKVIENLAEAMPEAEKAARLKAMEKLKINPHDEAPNVAIVEQIKHLYAMLLGEDRNYVMGLLGRFEAALDTQDPRKIEQERKEIAQILRDIETNYVR